MCYHGLLNLIFDSLLSNSTMKFAASRDDMLLPETIFKRPVTACWRDSFFTLKRKRRRLTPADLALRV